ncbi:hypothetical protein F0L74_05020 [Chitinophaga agrisoli]|uniref:3-keto-alpha-glucoside-1,2-lyase/3-keto-2-hydroxy-glucal hydratase domain-containing protein n=1 Tax=Chitinophaga agrisoli TaxID=2607653 RepID=A0A5B2W444_9BACT|nr:family 16 glycoside hydrolase [Chitinophaga agrisoli]KAA2245326.1 hypothetical protein F0L74_05020 [Chitinophaga agrisoli]
MSKILYISATILLFSLPGYSQQHADLSVQAVTAVNRTADNPAMGELHLSECPNPGIAWLHHINFRKGTISFEVKGKDVLQRSFVGIAFQGVNDTTYDAVYFRPFNFRAQDPARKSHSVQYISLPAYDWPKLREEHPNQYEQPIEPPPAPDDWFQVRIVVNSPTVQVFVNNQPTPSLQVQQLSHHAGGKLGLWVGNNSAGNWRNLTITPE